jgi:hypothetical protein
LIDRLWSKFGLGDSDAEQHKKLYGKEVMISGWGETETRFESNQLLKQYVRIGGFQNRLLELTHKEGFGACRGDSGGIESKCQNTFTLETTLLTILRYLYSAIK